MTLRASSVFAITPSMEATRSINSPVRFGENRTSFSVRQINSPFIVCPISLKPASRAFCLFAIIYLIVIYALPARGAGVGLALNSAVT